MKHIWWSATLLVAVIFLPLAGAEGEPLDQWLAEADGVPLQGKGELRKRLAQLPSARKLLARVLVKPDNLRRLASVITNQQRSPRQRLYAYFLLHQANQIHILGGDAYAQPLHKMLDSTTDDEMRAMAWAIAYDLTRLGSVHQRQPLGERADTVRALRDQAIRADASLSRQLVAEMDGARIDSALTERLSYSYVRGNTDPAAMMVLLDHYQSAPSAARKALVMDLAYTYAGSSRAPFPEQVKQRILAAARDFLFSGEGSGVDPVYAMSILADHGTIDDFRWIARAAETLPDGKWRDLLRGSIRGMAKHGRWPATVPVKDLDLKKLQPMPKPKPVARFRKRPAKLIREKLPAEQR